MGDKCRIQGRVVLGKMCEVDHGQIRQKTTNGLGGGGARKESRRGGGKSQKKQKTKRKWVKNTSGGGKSTKRLHGVETD